MDASRQTPSAAPTPAGVPRSMPLSLAEEGMRRIVYGSNRQSVMTTVRNAHIASQPLAGRRVLLCSHLGRTTGHCALILRDLGARVMVCGSNTWSTKDDVVAALAEQPGIEVGARHGAPDREFFGYLRAALAWGPDLIADDGAELLAMMHGVAVDSDEIAKPPRAVRGITEQTTTGILRIRKIQEALPGGLLRMPVIGVNECKTKHLIDNRYGSGESCLTAIVVVASVTLRGRVVVVVGYGHVGRGLAAQARGMGARVIVAERSPFHAIEAVMEGFQVMRLVDAVELADFVITATGAPNAVRADAIARVKDGAYLCNAGHLETEIDTKALAAASVEINRCVVEHIDEYVLSGSGQTPRRKVYLFAGGHTCNVATGKGHSADIIDLTFGLKLSALLYLAEKAWPTEPLAAPSVPLEPRLHSLPPELDAAVARMALAARGMELDSYEPLI